MKKIVKLLFAFVLVFTVLASLFAFKANVNAEPVNTDPNIVVQGAQLRADDKEGMRFVASVKDYVVPDGKTIAYYGFVLALGEAEASDEFVIDGTVNEKNVASVKLTELSDAEEKTFLCTIFNIPASSYGTPLSARAFVEFDDGTVVYGAESSQKSLAYVALQAIEAGETNPALDTFANTIKTSLSTTYKKYFMDAFGSVILDNSVYETEPAKLFVAFAADWNAFAASNVFTDENRPQTIDAAATREEMGPALKTALDGESEYDPSRPIVLFFNDATYGPKWAFLLDLFYNGGTIVPEDDISLKRQVEIIRGTIASISKNDWYNANNLITYIADFFSQTSYSAFPSAEIVGIQWMSNEQDLRKFFIRTTDVNVNSILADGANVVNEGDKFVLPATEPKTGYIGYYKAYVGGSEVSSADYEVGDEYTVTADKVIFLREYRLATYNVTYENVTGATHTNPATFQYTTPTIALTDATKTGYTFDGWFADSELTQAVTEIPQGTHEDLTLYAKFTPIVYNINYTLNGGTNAAANPATYTIEQAVAFADPTKEHYTFNAWYTEAGFTNATTGITLGSYGDKAVFAKFTPVDYTITYHLNDNLTNPATNNVANPATYNIETATIALADPARPGYAFAGWFTDAELTNALTEITLGSTGNLDLYAKWDLVDYTITYVLPDGATNNAGNPATINAEQTVTLLSPSKPLYTFVKWYKEAGFTNEITTLPLGTTANISVYAKFEETQYKKMWVDFMGNVYLDSQVYESNPAELYKLFATDWNAFLASDHATIEDFALRQLDVDATRDQIGVEISRALKASATFKATDLLVDFFNDDDRYAKWSWMLTMVTDAVNNPLTDGVNPIDDVSLGKQVAAINATYAGTPYEISKNDWYCGNNLITILADFFSQTDYSAFPPTLANPLTGITWRDADNNIDNRGYFFNTLNYNNVVLCANPNRVEVHEEITLPAFPTQVGETAYYMLGAVRYDVGDAYTVTTTSVQFLIEFEYTNYTITYVLDGGTNDVNNPATFRCVDTKTILPATKVGFTFDGWFTDQELTQALPESKIALGTVANVTLYAKFTATDYTITYNNCVGATHSNPATFQITTADITLADATKTGYDFGGWFSDALLTTPVTTIPTGTHENQVVYAKFTPTVYTITYELDGGTNAVANPATYTIEDTVALAAATKTGYNFIKWTEGGEDTTGIALGTTGNKTFSAVFSLTDFTVTYNNCVGATHSNPATFQITTADITLADATKTGYDFGGWFSDALLTTPVTTIPTGTHENQVVYAKFTPTVYTITYELDGGTNAVANPATYTIEDTVALAAATKTGYSFTKWTEGGEDTTGIALGTTGNKTFTAVFGINDYTITYNNVEGATHTNPATFKVTTADITLTPATKEGYDFAGWFSDALFTAQVTVIPTGTHENKVLYAKFVNYTVTYVLPAGATNSQNNPTTFTSQDAFTFEAPTKDGYAFDKWYAEGTFENVVDGVVLGTTVNVTVYAKFDAEPHAIKFDFNDAKRVIDIWDEFILDVQEGSDARAEYNAGFLTHSQTLDGELKGSNEYYYDYLPLKSALLNNIIVTSTGEEFRAKYEWLFDAMAAVHSLVSDKYTTAIQELADDVYPSSDAVYVFCQELKAFYYSANNANYKAVGFTDIQLAYESVYDWANDPDDQYEFLASYSETPSVTHNIPTDTTLSTVVPNPTRDGYVFAGWNTAEDGTGTTYDTAPASDITLYAMWN